MKIKVTQKEISNERIEKILNEKTLLKDFNELEYGDYLEGDFKFEITYHETPLTKQKIITYIGLRKPDQYLRFYTHRLDIFNGTSCVYKLNDQTQKENIVYFTVNISTLDFDIDLLLKHKKYIEENFIVSYADAEKFVETYNKETLLQKEIEKERAKEERNRLRSLAKIALQKEREI